MRRIAALLAIPALSLAQAPLTLTLKDAETLAAKQNPRVASARFMASAAHEVPKEISSVYQPMAFGSVTGAGAAEHLGVLDDVDIVMGTFSKSLASVGGFIAGPKAVVDYLKHTARPFVFSASLPAASVAAVAAALEVMRQEPERQQRLEKVSSQLRHELRSRGFSVLDGITPIVPVVIKEEEDLCHLCKSLLEEGIYINPVLRPAASHNLLRISCTAAHTDEHVDRLVNTITRVADRLGIPR